MMKPTKKRDPDANRKAVIRRLIRAAEWASKCLRDEACVPDFDLVLDCEFELRSAIADFKRLEEE